MIKIFGIEGCDEALARLVVAQERAHGRYVEAYEAGGRWYVSVYLPGLELTSDAPEWLKRAWKREDPAADHLLSEQA